MAADMARLMSALGFDRFAVAGHDRGGRVAYRMALDFPGRVAGLAVLDIVPTIDVLERANADILLGYWPWSLLAQPAPLPERLMRADPEAFVDAALNHWGSEGAAFPADIRCAYVNALRDPESVRAICEEYRAAASVDVEHDRVDRIAGRRIACQTLVLWAKGGAVDTSYDEEGGPLGIWRTWVRAEVHGEAIAGGHFFAEQNPAVVVSQLRAAFAG
jgi:haloacetate dehalogenase